MISRSNKRSESKRDDPEQSGLFIKKAREIGANDSALPADDLMGKLAKMPPDPKKKRKKEE